MMHPSLSPFLESAYARAFSTLHDACRACIHQLQGLLELDAFHQTGHQTPQLSSTLGPFGGQTLNLDALSQLIAKTATHRALDPDRRQRIHALLNQLEALIPDFAAPSKPAFCLLDAANPDAALDAAATHLDAFAQSILTIRDAQLEARGKHPANNPVDRSASWRALSAAERRLIPPFVILIEAPTWPCSLPLCAVQWLMDGLPVTIALWRSALQPAAALPAFPIERIPLAFPSVTFLQSSPAFDSFETHLPAALHCPDPVVLNLLLPPQNGPSDAFAALARCALRSHAFPAVFYNPAAAEGCVRRFDFSDNPSATDALPFGDFQRQCPGFDNPQPFANTWAVLSELAGTGNPHVQLAQIALRKALDAAHSAALKAQETALLENAAQRESAATASTVQRIIRHLTGFDVDVPIPAAAPQSPPK